MALVEAAHDEGMYVIFDIMLNHSGECFAYDVAGNPMRPPYDPPVTARGRDVLRVRYPFGAWLDVDNQPLPRGVAPRNRDEGVWPESLQSPECFSRAGAGHYGEGDAADEQAQFRVSDYRNRDFAYPPHEGPSPVLDALTRIWCDWIDLTGCDGFRIDTFKHVPRWVAQKATADIRAHAAAAHGKTDFLVFGEVAGGDFWEADYAGFDGVRLLELSERRTALRALGRGRSDQAALVLTPPGTVEQKVDGQVVSRPLPADRLILTIDDHDGLWDGAKLRLAADSPDYVLPAVACLMFGPSIPCLYYGIGQALSGPVGAGGFLDDFGRTDPRRGGDRYLREAMFGPEHPRKAGLAGRPGPGGDGGAKELFDERLPGFGPGGSTGVHVFDPASRWYRGIAALAAARRAHPVLATGAISRLTRGRIDGGGFGQDVTTAVVAWLRHDEATGAWGEHEQAAEVDTRPQTGEAVLRVDALTPGEIRVYVS